MSIDIRLKHSATANKAPQPSDLKDGELALNINAASPAAYIKDNAGNIVKLAGAGAIGGTPATETAAGIAELATQAEVTAGTDDHRIVTPLKLHKAVPAASETAKGKVELATAAETTTGTDHTRAVHPAGLKVELDKKVKKAGDTMTGDLVMNDGTNDVITLDASAGSITSTDGTKSVVVNKNGTVVATGDIQSTSQNGGQLAGFRNQIINGDLRIWQRGTSVSPGGSSAYSSDRWFASATMTRVAKGGTQSLGFADEAVLEGPSGASIRQAVELVKGGAMSQFAPGTTWTFSYYSTASGFNVDGGFASSAKTLSAGEELFRNQAPVSLGGNRYSYTFTVPPAQTIAATSICFVVGVVKTDAVNSRVCGFQLEPGPVATPFEHRPIGAELALCQRYYAANSGMALSMTRLTLSGGNETQVVGYVTFPVSMRATPTVTMVVNSGSSPVTNPDASGFRGRVNVATTAVSSLTAYTADAEL